jgi:hypothetical protein
VGCFEINRGGAIVIKRAFPARHAHAPFVAGFESGEAEFRMRRNQIISIEHREIEKLLGNFHANRVEADVFRTRAAKAIAVESGHRVKATTFQLCPQNIRRHKASSVNSSLAVVLSEAKHLGFISSALIQERSEILRSAQNDIGR